MAEINAESFARNVSIAATATCTPLKNEKCRRFKCLGNLYIAKGKKTHLSEMSDVRYANMLIIIIVMLIEVSPRVYSVWSVLL